MFLGLKIQIRSLKKTRSTNFMGTLCDFRGTGTVVDSFLDYLSTLEFEKIKNTG
jgi:hypothetical protein